MRVLLVGLLLGSLMAPESKGWVGAPDAQEPYEKLVAALRGSDLNAKWEAQRMIAQLGPSDKGAVPLLIAALRDESANVRAWAARGLERIRSADSAPALVPLLKDSQRTVRRNAAFALVAVSPSSAAQYAVPILIEALGEPNPYPGSGQPWDVPCEAASALGSVGPPATAAAPHLRQALQSQSPSLRICAAEALVRLGDSVHGMPPLLQALHDDTEYVRKEAVDALGRLGPLAKEAVPALREIVQKDSPYMRAAAADAIGRIEARR